MITEAITQKRQVTTLDPSVESALRDAQNFRMSGNYRAALNIFNEIIDRDPSNSRALYQKADVLDCMGNYMGAVKCYDSALDCDPYNAEVWYNKGMTLRKVGMHKAAFAHIQKGIYLSMGEI